MSLVNTLCRVPRVRGCLVGLSSREMTARPWGSELVLPSASLRRAPRLTRCGSEVGSPGLTVLGDPAGRVAWAGETWTERQARSLRDVPAHGWLEPCTGFRLSLLCGDPRVAVSGTGTRAGGGTLLGDFALNMVVTCSSTWFTARTSG